MSEHTKDCFTAVFSLKAEKKIKDCVKSAKGHIEVGWVLLGHRVGKVFYVTDITIPVSASKGDLVSFVLNGEEHSKSALMLAKMYYVTPYILGIWHSHICDFNLSNQDRQSNIIMASVLGGTLAVLYTDCISTFYIDVDGQEYGTEFICDRSEILIPKEYLLSK